MKSIIFGDLCITESNKEAFSNGNINKIVSDELLTLIRKYDFFAFNLECPLISNDSRPINKCGPTLGANKECINGIKEINPSLVFLANNHIYDYGFDGFKTTIDELKDKNINHIGNKDKEPNNVFIKNKLGIINFCENEFSFNYKDEAGACCLDNSTYVQINELKKKVDKLIVIFHGGTENFEYPSPNLVNMCHSFVELGANLVLCQHSHRIGCYEKYKEATIVYGQGNFLFDAYSSDDKWTHGLGVIYDDETNEVNYVVTKFANGKIEISKEDTDKILKEFNNKSDELKSGKYLSLYNGFCEKRYIKFLCKIRGYSRIRTGIEMFIFKGFFVKKHYFGKRKYVLYDLLNCEAHKELLQNMMKEEVFQKTKE